MSHYHWISIVRCLNSARRASRTSWTGSVRWFAFWRIFMKFGSICTFLHLFIPFRSFESFETDGMSAGGPLWRPCDRSAQRDAPGPAFARGQMKCPTHKLNRLHISYIELRVYIYKNWIYYIILYCIVLYYIILYYIIIYIYICMHCIIYTLSFTTLK